jgi:hypothetical protein
MRFSLASLAYHIQPASMIFVEKNWSSQKTRLTGCRLVPVQLFAAAHSVDVMGTHKRALVAVRELRQSSSGWSMEDV